MNSWRSSTVNVEPVAVAHPLTFSGQKCLRSAPPQQQLGMTLVPAGQALARLFVIDQIAQRPTEN